MGEVRAAAPAAPVVARSGGIGPALLTLREDLAPLQGFGAGTYHPVRIRPSLRFTMVPAPQGRSDDADRPTEHLGEVCRRSSERWASAAMAAAGLVEAAKSDATGPEPLRRHGNRGLPAAGALLVEDFCALTRQSKNRFGLWTVTIPASAGACLEEISDGWSRFQDVIRRRFSEAHRRAALRETRRLGVEVPPHWVFVVEPQDNGRPHMHFVFRSKGASGRRWLLSRNRLDSIIRQALYAVTGRRFDCKAAGNVQTLRKDPGSYLGGYLKKGRMRPGSEVIYRAGYSQNMVPKSWWGRSDEARAWVLSHVSEVPRLLVSYLSLHWPRLMEAGHLQAKVIQLEGEFAPAVVVGRWRGLGGLLAAMETLQLECWTAQRAPDWAGSR